MIAIGLWGVITCVFSRRQGRIKLLLTYRANLDKGLGYFFTKKMNLTSLTPSANVASLEGL